MLLTFTHTYAPWAARKKNENGAATYSADIVATQLPHWTKLFSAKKYADKNILLSTCPLARDISPRGIKAPHIHIGVQYLHTYPYKDPLDYILTQYKRFPKKHPNKGHFHLYFLSAYASYVHLINHFATQHRLPITAIFIPMAISTEAVISAPVLDPDRGKSVIPDEAKRRSGTSPQILYFGNVYKDKLALFNLIRKAATAAGYQFHYISRQRFNGQGPLLSQAQTWELISRYRFGIGVGRCALEMYALGLRVLIAGARTGGVLMSDHDFRSQTATNFNGRIVTFDRDPAACLAVLPISHQPTIRSITTLNHAEIFKSATKEVTLAPKKV